MTRIFSKGVDDNSGECMKTGEEGGVLASNSDASHGSVTSSAAKRY